tara:strand:- start:2352 stop:2939 length:588 start_codon:yes stop_codon:yes gene_type:complete
MNKLFYYFILVVLIMGVGANWVINKANSSYELPIVKPVPEFSFYNQDGEVFSQENLEGKITILDFFFTSCAGPCPIMAYNMKELYHDFSEITEVQFVSITVDPNTDSIMKLKQYAEVQGVYDSRWQFLSSDIDRIKDLKRNGFMLFADELPQGHAIKFILIDQNGIIRKYFDGTDDASIASLRMDITNLAKNFEL